ncbi:response regulator [Patescibacteria group bacterium]|nr:response regulator [Patescibacteria group bacterium]MBU2259220.1 response regulator [Patescibacteria group bacterium]
MKILLAEDNGILANLYKSMLEKAGHTVYVEPDGEQALYRMRRWKPDLVLLDIKLPKKTGYEVLAERKGDPELKKIPVIVLTGMDESETRRKAEELGADGYIHKVKVEIDPLLGMIEKLVPGED